MVLLNPSIITSVEIVSCGEEIEQISILDKKTESITMVEEKVDWYPMWKSLGVDIAKHDMLLAVLPELFKVVYIDSQTNRPSAMAFWDFVVGDIHGIRVSELIEAKKKGQKIVGTFCLYVPDEIILAFDAICVGLCGGTNFSNYAVEDKLPANTCPLIKSALGFSFGKTCPYYLATDLLVGETTCDGKKKAWEVLSQDKDVYVLETPQKKGTPQSKEHYIAEINAFIQKMEHLTGKQLTVSKLKAAITTIQQKRDLIARVYSMRKAIPVPISGKDALLVSQVAFYDDPNRQIEMLGKLVAELEQRVNDHKGAIKANAKRILISGTPMAIPNWKLHHIIESRGAAVVVEETCTGTRYFNGSVDAFADTLPELIDRLADRYLSINCACFTPNLDRLADIQRLIEEYHVDGVILYTLSFCQPYEIEAMQFERHLKAAGHKVMSITTDYSNEDEGQLTTRIEAFLEIL